MKKREGFLSFFNRLLHYYTGISAHSCLYTKTWKLQRHRLPVTGQISFLVLVVRHDASKQTPE
jgi:hypothetical protein